MKGFNEQEIKRLLDQIQEASINGKSLSNVFESFAISTGRAKGSVRNFYYKLLKDSKTDYALQQKYPPLKNLKAEKSVAFSKEEENSLIEKIENSKKSGKSVRRVIMELSGGDDKLALRYQNKYRNAKTKEQLKNKGDKNRIKEKSLKALEDAIDSLVDRMNRTMQKEIDRLNKKVQDLILENKSLKKQIGLGVVKSYFNGAINFNKDEELK